MTGVLILIRRDKETDVQCTDERPCEDPVRKQLSVNQGKRPQETSLLIPSFWTSSCEEINH